VKKKHGKLREIKRLVCDISYQLLVRSLDSDVNFLLICVICTLGRHGQVPMYVATKMASIRNPSFFAPSPETYARAAVRYIGYEPLCTPYWAHAVQWFLFSLLPEPVADKYLLDRALRIRANGHAKDERKKAQ
jgi:hypothetical protein